MKSYRFSVLSIAAVLLVNLAAVPCFTAAAEEEETFTDEVLTYAYVDGGVSIVDCDEGITKLQIPEAMMGYPIVSIGDEAFANCASLASITIEAPITSVGTNAFANCTSLTSIQLPDTVTKLGDAAFYQCSALTDVTLSDNITEMGLYCFAYCFELKEITMPAALKAVPSYCFFYDFTLESVELNEGLERMDTLAFVGCYVLEELNIPASLTTFSPLSVLACAKLKRITVADGNQAFCATEDGVLMNADCTELLLYPSGNEATSYTVPDTVKTISYYAVSGAFYLEEVILPDSLTTIGEGAFSDCLALKTVRIPDGVTVIENSVFADCSALTDITIPAQITSIGEYAFFCCSSLTEIVIPEQVTSVGAYAFCGCSGVNEITVPDTVIEIGDYAFGYLAQENEETDNFTPVLQEGFKLRGNSSSAAKHYAGDFDVAFDQTNFPIVPVMAIVSGVLVVAVVVVFIIDFRKRRALNTIKVDESAITDPEAAQDANYSSILADDEEGDPFDRSYGFVIDEPVGDTETGEDAVDADEAE